MSAQDRVPGLIEHTLSNPEPLKTLQDSARVEGPPATLDSTAVDAGASPAFRFRKASVIGALASGNFVEATSASIAAGAAAAVVSAEAPDGDWTTETLIVRKNGTEVFNAALTGNNLATVSAELNGDALFAESLVAEDDGGGNLRIRALEPGSGHDIRVDFTLATGYANALGTGSYDSGQGSDPDYRVTLFDADTQNELGVAEDVPVKNLLSGVFDETKLNFLTGEAKGVLKRRGSLFFDANGNIT